MHSYYYAVNDQQNRYSLEYRYPREQLDHPDNVRNTCYLYFNPHRLIIMPVT
jgi:hypothetical protein